MALILPLNQLLSSEPTNIVAIPIHSSVIMPWIKEPTIILLVIIEVMPVSGSMRLEGIFENPLTIATSIMSIPEKNRKYPDETRRCRPT